MWFSYLPCGQWVSFTHLKGDVRSYQTSMIELSSKLVNGWKALTIFTKSFIINGSRYSRMDQVKFVEGSL